MNVLEKIFINRKNGWMCEVKFNYCKPSLFLGYYVCWKK